MLLDLYMSQVDLCLAAPNKCNPRAQLGEAQGQSFPDSTAGPGNQDISVLKLV